MPSESQNLSTQTEKPQHYTYLKEFRTQQCPLFLQHKCTQHRPYTCFHWHFMNQRRRRPIRKKDGVFNYSPDTYCTKYDETTGICPDGDDCPNLHRTAGDTERRYHLRYYKTCTCVYETDTRGHCVKNGPHCAFAHGAHDLRQPVHDLRELQSSDSEGNVAESPLGSSLEKDRIINEDPRWNDTNYVLANYKTEPCKRPPRLCRQGYACPSYHNSRDKRRSPRKYKYRSTPCPNVKHGDDWGDPQQCEHGDSCAYCHTRTEQQFHPEIYKSTKCNDMVQNSYCPRGPFCAFAHVEQEMLTARDMCSPAENPLTAFVTNALPPQTEDAKDDAKATNNNAPAKPLVNNGVSSTENGGFLLNKNELCDISPLIMGMGPTEPAGQTRMGTMPSTEAGTELKKAPGCERDHTKLLHQLQSIDCDPALDVSEKSRRKQTVLMLSHMSDSPQTSSGLGSSQGTSPSSTLSPSLSASAMSPHAPSFYPPRQTVQSVIGNALDEDLNLADLSLSTLDRDLALDNDNNSVCSSLSAGFPSAYAGAASVPVTIPSGGAGSDYPRQRLGSLSHSPCSSPITGLPSAGYNMQHQRQEQAIHEAAAAFLSQPNPGKFSAPGFPELASMSPRGSVGSIPPSPLVGSNPTFPYVNGYGSAPSSTEARLREELSGCRAKLSQWEEGMVQARSACDAWKQEAEEASKRAKHAVMERDEARAQLLKLQRDVEMLRNSSFARCLQSMQGDMDPMALDKMGWGLGVSGCLVCQDVSRPFRLSPCRHFALCEMCMSKGGAQECPHCHSQQVIPPNSTLLPI